MFASRSEFVADHTTKLLILVLITTMASSVCNRRDRSHIFRLWIRSCHKIFVSGSRSEFFQIWECDSCSDSSKHWWNRNSAM